MLDENTCELPPADIQPLPGWMFDFPATGVNRERWARCIYMANGWPFKSYCWIIKCISFVWLSNQVDQNKHTPLFCIIRLSIYQERRISRARSGAFSCFHLEMSPFRNCSFEAFQLWVVVPNKQIKISFPPSPQKAHVVLNIGRVKLVNQYNRQWKSYLFIFFKALLSVNWIFFTAHLTLSHRTLVWRGTVVEQHWYQP